MPRPKKLTDDIFVRMPSGTKSLLERYSGTSPAPATWVRALLVDALRREATNRGEEDPFPGYDAISNE